MDYYSSQTYLSGLRKANRAVCRLSDLFHSSVLITGASGLLGSYLTDMLSEANRDGADITVYALGRSEERLQKRFAARADDPRLHLVPHDVNTPPAFSFGADFVLHAASNAYPAAFNTDPVGTLMSNITGTKYLLDHALGHGTKRFLFVSSGEVYGQGDLSLDSFSEDYGGFVDPTSPRSCYPNGKRAAETLCAAFTKQYGLETVSVRPSHTFGPTATKSDNRAHTQFINRGLAGEDIILNSAGSQMRSYTYVADTASAILTVLTSGKIGEAYNVANPASRATVADFAREVARQTGTKVVFAEPDAVAAAERTPIAKQVLSSRKLEDIGWKGQYTLEEGIAETLRILREAELC